MSEYKHIKAGKEVFETDDVYPNEDYEYVFIPSIFRVYAIGEHVGFVDDHDASRNRTLLKADAIAALEELIDYIRSEGK